MNRTVVDETKLYRNVRSGMIVKVTAQDGLRASIATVEGGQVGRLRSVPLTAIHTDPLNREGQAHTSGYVPLVSTSQSANADSNGGWSDMDLIDSLDSLSDEELTDLAAKHEQIKKESEEIAGKAKDVLKSRRGDNLGLILQGDYALVFKSGAKFDPKAALRNLNAVDFQRILLPKPDAAHARKVFEYEPEKLAACMTDNGPSLTIRVATADDKARVAAMADSELDIEDYVV